MSEFYLIITLTPGKANIVADALFHCADLDPTIVAAVSVGVKSDLLAAIFLAYEQDSLDTFCDLTCHAIASDRGMCMHDVLVYCTSHTEGQAIVIPDGKGLN